jgi:hypothetical protein
MLQAPSLTENAQTVFKLVRKRVAMPLQEIAAETGIGGSDLKDTVNELEKENRITVKKPDDPLQTIISVSGKYL